MLSSKCVSHGQWASQYMRAHVLVLLSAAAIYVE